MLPTLISQPAVTSAHIQEATGLSQPAADNVIGRLREAGILITAAGVQRYLVRVATDVTPRPRRLRGARTATLMRAFETELSAASQDGCQTACGTIALVRRWSPQAAWAGQSPANPACSVNDVQDLLLDAVAVRLVLDQLQLGGVFV
jgi:hypothetical protein